MDRVSPASVIDDLAMGARIAADIHELGRLTGAMVGEEKPDEVTIEQYWILRLLYDSGPHPIKDIASEMGTTHSPITLSVKRLEQRGLVRRERGTEDERVVIVHLTDHGTTLFREWRRGRRKALRDFFGSLSEKERGSLLRLLDKLLVGKSRVRTGQRAV